MLIKQLKYKSTILILKNITTIYIILITKTIVRISNLYNIQLIIKIIV